MIKYLEIDGVAVGLDHLDRAIEEVRGLGLDPSDGERLSEALLERVLRSNYVSEAARPSLKKALLQEYLIASGEKARDAGQEQRLRKARAAIGRSKAEES